MYGTRDMHVSRLSDGEQHSLWYQQSAAVRRQ